MISIIEKMILKMIVLESDCSGKLCFLENGFNAALQYLFLNNTV